VGHDLYNAVQNKKTLQVKNNTRIIIVHHQSSTAAKLRLFDKFRDMQQRWHPDFEEEVGKTVRGGLALCKFKP